MLNYDDLRLSTRALSVSTRGANACVKLIDMDFTRAIRFNARGRNIINPLLLVAHGIEQTKNFRIFTLLTLHGRNFIILHKVNFTYITLK